MSVATSFINQGSTHAERAIQYDRQAISSNENIELFENAKNSYIQAIEYYMTALKYEKNNHVKNTLREKIQGYMDRVEVMKNWISNHNINNNNLLNSASTSTSNYVDAGIKHAETAINYDKEACENGKDPQLYENAKNSYITAMDYFFTALKHEKNEQIKCTLREKVSVYMDRAEVMNQWLSNYNKQKAQQEQQEQQEQEKQRELTRNASKPLNKPLKWFKKNKRPKE